MGCACTTSMAKLPVQTNDRLLSDKVFPKEGSQFQKGIQPQRESKLSINDPEEKQSIHLLKTKNTLNKYGSMTPSNKEKSLGIKSNNQLKLPSIQCSKIQLQKDKDKEFKISVNSLKNIDLQTPVKKKNTQRGSIFSVENHNKKSSIDKLDLDFAYRDKQSPQERYFTPKIQSRMNKTKQISGALWRNGKRFKPIIIGSSSLTRSIKKDTVQDLRNISPKIIEITQRRKLEDSQKADAKSRSKFDINESFSVNSSVVSSSKDMAFLKNSPQRRMSKNRNQLRESFQKSIRGTPILLSPVKNGSLDNKIPRHKISHKYNSLSSLKKMLMSGKNRPRAFSKIKLDSSQGVNKSPPNRSQINKTSLSPTKNKTVFGFNAPSSNRPKGPRFLSHQQNSFMSILDPLNEEDENQGVNTIVRQTPGESDFKSDGTTPSLKREVKEELEKINSCSNSDDLEQTVQNLESFLEVQKDDSIHVQSNNIIVNTRRSENMSSSQTSSSSVNSLTSVSMSSKKSVKINNELRGVKHNYSQVPQKNSSQMGLLDVFNKKSPNFKNNNDRISKIKKSLFCKNRTISFNKMRPFTNNKSVSQKVSPSNRTIIRAGGVHHHINQQNPFLPNNNFQKFGAGVDLKRKNLDFGSHRFIKEKNSTSRSPFSQSSTKNIQFLNKRKIDNTPRPSLQVVSHSIASLCFKKADYSDLKGIEKYILMQQLGSGQYSKVKMAKNKIDDSFCVRDLLIIQAMKIIDVRAVKSRIHDPAFDIEQEFRLMQDLDHPNIVKVNEVIHENEAGREMLYVSIELVSGFELGSSKFWDSFNRSTGLPNENRIMSVNFIEIYTHQIVEAVHYRKSFNYLSLTNPSALIGSYSPQRSQTRKSTGLQRLFSG